MTFEDHFTVIRNAIDRLENTEMSNGEKGVRVSALYSALRVTVPINMTNELERLGLYQPPDSPVGT